MNLNAVLKPFVEDELKDRIIAKDAVVFHPGDNITFADLPRKFQTAVMAFGPEGGFTDYEIEKFIECGFIPCSLTERILRTEYAVNAALGKIF